MATDRDEFKVALEESLTCPRAIYDLCPAQDALLLVAEIGVDAIGAARLAEILNRVEACLHGRPKACRSLYHLVKDIELHQYLYEFESVD